MKNKLNTMTAVAVLVMSMTGAAHAAGNTQPQIRMLASVAKTTCDITTNNPNGVTADFGEMTQAEVFAAATTPIASAKHLVLDFGQCSGADVAKSGVVNLIATSYTPAAGSGNAAFGDGNNNLGYGFDVKASWTNDDTLSDTTATEGIFTPATDKIEILKAHELTTAATLKLPVVTLTPQLTSWAANDSDIPEDSKVDTTVTFAVAYN